MYLILVLEIRNLRELRTTYVLEYACLFFYFFDLRKSPLVYYIPELCTCVGENPPVARRGVGGVVPVTINYYNFACPQSFLWLLEENKKSHYVNGTARRHYWCSSGTPNAAPEQGRL